MLILIQTVVLLPVFKTKCFSHVITLINPILNPTLTDPSPTLQSPMFGQQSVSPLSAQPIGLKKSPAAECRDLCGDNGVKEYLSNSTTDGNVGVQVNKGGKAGVGINGSHENKDVCVCYPPQLTK